MSELKVEVVSIDNILPHPNADKLELAVIKGWNCVVRKGDFHAGDSAVYIPIDSILPNEVEAKIFGPDSKIKLHNSRVKTIKLRGAISQGLLVTPSTVDCGGIAVGTDVRERLNIRKYEPPAADQGSLAGRASAAKRLAVNENFKKYTDIQNAKNFNKFFDDGELVSVTEKIHGTNFRCGYVKRQLRWWQKPLLWVKLISDYEFVYGSHNVQLSAAKISDPTNVYGEAVLNYQLREKLRHGEVVYGEIYGAKIQKGYAYGCKDGERKLALFDVAVEGKFLSVDEFFGFCWARNLPTVQELYRGPFNFESIKALLTGNSQMVPEQKTIEGGVCKPLEEASSFIGRKVLKFINDEYLLKDTTDLH